MRYIQRILSILVQVFLVGLLVQFFLHTLVTYKFGLTGPVWSFVWLWKELLIAFFLFVVCGAAFFFVRNVGLESFIKKLKQHAFFRFLMYFASLCGVSFVLALFFQKVGI